MFSTILIAFLVLAALVCLAVRKVKYSDGYSHEEKFFPLWLVGLGVLFLAIVVTLFSCTTIVQARQEGVLTTFGKPSERTLDPGLSLKAPWQKVTKVSTARETEQFNTPSTDKNGDAIKIPDDHQNEWHHLIVCRLGNGSATSVYAALTWAPNPDAVDSIFADYRGDDPTENLYERFVAPQFKLAVADICAHYNPTADLAEVAAKNSDDDPANDVAPASVRIAPEYDVLSEDLLTTFTDRVDDQKAEDGEPLVNVISALISGVPFDAQTEKKIAQYQDAVQETIISAQRVKTAENQAAANRVLAESISKEPGVLTSRCLDLIADGFQPPAAFSCFGPSTAQPVVPVP